MSGRVFCVASAKGGSGKTTVTASIATFIVALGKSVLVVDCDEATHGMTLLFIDGVSDFGKQYEQDHENQEACGLFDISDINAHSADAFRTQNGFDFIPATFHFSLKEETSFSQLEDALSILVSRARLVYDYIILDAQAGADAVSRVAMSRSISDDVIVVSEYDPLSAAGIERMKSMLPDDLAFDRTWIMFNKMLPEFIEKFASFFAVSHYLAPIAWNADVVRAYAQRSLALDFENGNEFTVSLLNSLKGLPDRELRLSLEDWSENKVSLLREPINGQYADTEKMLNATVAELAETMHRSRSIPTLSALSAVLVVLAVLAASSEMLGFQELLGKSNIKYSDILFFVLTMTVLTLFLFIEYYGNRKRKERSIHISALERQVARYEDRLAKLDRVRDAQSLADILNARST